MSDTTAAMAERSKTERHGADQWEVGSAKRMIKENIMKDKWWNSLEFVGMMFFFGGVLVLFSNTMGKRTFCLTSFWCLVSR